MLEETPGVGDGADPTTHVGPVITKVQQQNNDHDHR
jgi:hypothetical protein